ncbi:MAG: Flp pilus assembly protein CpaB, partial [Gemmatimonadales bacterium]
MATRRLRPWIILVLALLCGAVAAMLAVRFLRQQTTPLLAETPKGRVVVANRNLSVGTVLTPADIKLVDWPASSLPLGYIATTAAAVGRGVTRQVQENEPFLESKLAPKGAGGGLQISITEGM